MYFVASGVSGTDGGRYDPFLAEGVTGLLSATGLVFVSYAGVTSIASIAEEVKRPARTIPRAMITSILFMTALYPFLVVVMVGVTPSDALAGSVTPMSAAAAAAVGTGFSDVIAVVAILALVSIANAGLLASSRYPLAMARNGLAPPFLDQVNPRTGTPIRAIVLTGSLLLFLIAVGPVLELAKLASAFQLIVLSLVNLALIAFRESHLDWYRPSFKSPLYPWIQIFGIVACLALLAFMGIVPIVGAVLIVGGGVLWYRGFGRSRTSHESASLDAVRNRASGQLVAETEAALSSTGKRHVVIPVHTETSDQRLRDLLRCADAVTAVGGVIDVIRLDPEGPEGRAHPAASDIEIAFDERVGAEARALAVEPVVLHITGCHRRQAIDGYIRSGYVDLVLTELLRGREDRDFTHDMEWLGDRAYCDFVFLGNRYLAHIDDIARSSDPEVPWTPSRSTWRADSGDLTMPRCGSSMFSLITHRDARSFRSGNITQSWTTSSDCQPGARSLRATTSWEPWRRGPAPPISLSWGAARTRTADLVVMGGGSDPCSSPDRPRRSHWQAR